jgi:hypothetical protein
VDNGPQRRHGGMSSGIDCSAMRQTFTYNRQNRPSLFFPHWTTLELTGAVITALPAVFIPIVCLIIIGIFCILVFRKAIGFLLERARASE